MSLSRNIGEYIEKNETSLVDVENALKKYKLESLLPNILRFLKKKDEEKRKKETIVIESPYPLNEEALLQIRKILGDSEASCTHIHKEELLAGFRAKYKDVLYDGSAKRIIDQLENTHY